MSGASAMDIIFKLKAVPSFELVVRGSGNRTEDWGDRNVCMLLPTSVPGEWAFRIIHSGRYDHHCRVKLPSDAGAAAMLKEMTDGPWAIFIDYPEPNKLLASYHGIDLPPILGPILLEACTPKPPLASPDTVAPVVGTELIMDTVLRFAIDTPFDAARAALVARAWAEGVRGWMAAPREETINKRSSYSDKMYAEKQRTGLPRALKVQHFVSTPEEIAALVALLRATVRPSIAASDRIEAASEAPGRSMGALSFSPVKLKGLPGTTFVWRNYGRGFEGASAAVYALYLLEGADPTFRQLLVVGTGDMGGDPDLHLQRFLALRTRLRAAFPALAAVPDAKLLALLAHAWGGPDPHVVQEEFAAVRLMPGHPDRGDGQPATEAEQQAARFRRGDLLPTDLGAGGRDRPPRTYCEGMIRFMVVRGMAVPWSNVQGAMAAIDAFHRGQE